MIMIMIIIINIIIIMIILISIVIVKVIGSIVFKQKSIDYVYLAVFRLLLSLIKI